MWKRKNGFEDKEIDLAAQRTLEGWRIAAESLERVKVEPALITDRKQERPSAAMLERSSDAATGSRTDEAELATFSRKGEHGRDAQVHLDRQTAQALSLLES